MPHGVAPLLLSPYQPCRDKWGNDGFGKIEMLEDKNKDSPGTCYMLYVSCTTAF